MLATTVWFAVVVAKVFVIEVLVHGMVCIGRMCVAKAHALSKLFAFTTKNRGTATAALHLHPPMLHSSHPSCSGHRAVHIHS